MDFSVVLVAELRLVWSGMKKQSSVRIRGRQLWSVMVLDMA